MKETKYRDEELKSGWNSTLYHATYFLKASNVEVFQGERGNEFQTVRPDKEKVCRISGAWHREKGNTSRWKRPTRVVRRQ